MSAPPADARDRPGDGVDLWISRIGDVRATHGLVDAYRDLMTEEERARERRFHFEADRLRYATARALVRTTLSRYGAREARAWRFTADRFGKPHLDADGAAAVPGLSFNLSHSGDLVVLAVAAGCTVGVDVERIRDRGNLPGLAAHVFAPEEAQALARVDPVARAYRFFEHWTLKEAYIKARGMGLSLSLSSFGFDLDTPGAIRFSTREPDQDAAAWSFWRGDPDPEHPLALCIGAAALPAIRTTAVTPLVGTRRSPLAAGRTSAPP
ncbi:4'-phosphopantetheinyl transferase family protein [Salinarimonas rosea]|uniref:4'-phosphopantetheinyl transferase family protein n=1 Tax=Salinarimonas rosea TaxID=552063 RepID=UPI00041035E5|nr:4'-phosphopantetheinyl transferase superfamily protein [Salinarimonas rosea]